MGEIGIASRDPIANVEMLIMARDLRMVTHKQLAASTGIPIKQISAYLNGRQPCSGEHLAKIAEVLEFPIAFFTREGKRRSAFCCGAGGCIHLEPEPLPGAITPREQAIQLIANITDSDMETVVAALQDVSKEFHDYRAGLFRAGNAGEIRDFL